MSRRALRLLDTNIVSYILRGTLPRADARLLSAPANSLYISVITRGELKFGLSREPKALRLARLVDDFLIRVPSLDWNSDAADAYGTLRAELEPDRGGFRQRRHAELAGERRDADPEHRAGPGRG